MSSRIACPWCPGVADCICHPKEGPSGPQGTHDTPKKQEKPFYFRLLRGGRLQKVLYPNDNQQPPTSSSLATE